MLPMEFPNLCEWGLLAGQVLSKAHGSRCASSQILRFTQDDKWEEAKG